MADTPVRTKEIRGRKPYDALAVVGCEGVTCDFVVAIEDFDLAKFYETTGLRKIDTQWSTVFHAEQETTGYHVQFNGRIKSKRVHLTLDYFGRSVTRPKGDGPFAETAMVWLGSFFKKNKERAYVHARFSLPISAWGSRFNLPFTVNMGGSGREVGIDGIAMRLPKNSAKAERGWLNLIGNQLLAAASMNTEISFNGFRVLEEIAIYREALKIFVYERGSKDV